MLDELDSYQELFRSQLFTALHRGDKAGVHAAFATLRSYLTLLEVEALAHANQEVE